MSTVICHKPVGWWLSYKEGQWVGPFKDEQELLEAADYLVPLSYSEFTVLHVAPWEEKKIKTRR